jgi:hypothetical protein
MERPDYVKNRISVPIGCNVDESTDACAAATATGHIDQINRGWRVFFWSK